MLPCPLMVVATGPYFIRISAAPQRVGIPAGAHGYDPNHVPEMKALFVAAGPDIRSGVTLPSFENVDVYPFIAKILGLDITHLKTGPIDGKLDVTPKLCIDSGLASRCCLDYGPHRCCRLVS